MVKKIDFAFHQAQFDKAVADNPALSVRAYCESVGINPNTGRKNIKASRKANVFKASTTATSGKETTIKADVDNDTRTKAQKRWRSVIKDFLTKATKNPSLSLSDYCKEQDLNYSTTRRQYQIVTKYAEMRSLLDLFEQKKALFRNVRDRNERKKIDGSDNRSNGGSDAQKCADRPSESDHSIPIQPDLSGKYHGGYSLLASVDAQLAAVLTEVDPLSVSNELLLARSRFVTMNRVMNKQLHYVDEMEQSDIEILNDDGVAVSYDSERERILFKHNAHLNALSATIAKLTSNESKHRLSLYNAERERLMSPNLLPAQEQCLVIDMLERREVNGWSATDTAKKIETLGAKVPEALMFEAKLEMTTIEPEIISSGISEAELDRRAIEYMESNKDHETVWLPNRLEEIEREEERIRLLDSSAISADDIEDYDDVNEIESLLDNFEPVEPDIEVDVEQVIG